MAGRSGFERREYATLVAELRALDADIDSARAVAPRATHEGGLELHAHREHPHVRGEHVRLADGAHIVIRPAQPGDVDEVRETFDHLSAVSRFRQFRESARRPTERELAEMTDANHASHEAMVAFAADTADGIGIARYVRAPDDPHRAELTCTVAEPWQRRGVGTALAERLAVRARAAGIERFTASILVGDNAARRLLGHVADEITEHRRDGTVQIAARPRPVATDGSAASTRVPRA